MITIRFMRQRLFLDHSPGVTSRRAGRPSQNRAVLSPLPNPSPKPPRFPKWPNLPLYRPTGAHPMPSRHEIEAIHFERYEQISSPIYIVDTDAHGNKHAFLFNYDKPLRQWLCEHRYNPVTRRPIDSTNIFRLPRHPGK